MDGLIPARIDPPLSHTLSHSHHMLEETRRKKDTYGHKYRSPRLPKSPRSPRVPPPMTPHGAHIRHHGSPPYGIVIPPPPHPAFAALRSPPITMMTPVHGADTGTGAGTGTGTSRRKRRTRSHRSGHVLPTPPEPVRREPPKEPIRREPPKEPIRREPDRREPPKEPVRREPPRLSDPLTLVRIRETLGIYNNITIGDYTFYLICKKVAGGGYKQIKIISLNYLDDPVGFIAYKSQSGNEWKICVENTNGRDVHWFDKGSDYVQGSMIHYKLQIFIHQKYNIISECPRKINFDSTHDSKEDVNAGLNPDLDKYINSNKCIHVKDNRGARIISNILNSADREDSNEVFKPLLLWKSGDLEKTFIEMYSSSYNEIHDKAKEEKRKSVEKKLAYYSHMHDIYSTTDITFSGNLYNRKKQFIIFLVKVYNDYMALHFEARSEEIRIANMGEELVNGYTINSTYYKKTITHNITKRKYICIYNKYQVTNTPSGVRDSRGTYNIPVSFIPEESDNVISRFGIYRTYVSAGLYIYKMFEYVGQILPEGFILDVSGRIAKVRAGVSRLTPNNYVFIGDLLNGLYPNN